MYPFAKTVESVTKAGLMGMMIGCAGLAVTVVIVLVTIVTSLTAHLVNVETGWLDSLVNWIVGGITGIAGWFMLPALVVLIAGMFQEKTIDRVERAYYPEEARIQPPRFWPDLRHDIRFTTWALFLNILVLPFYLFGIGFILSIGLNSYLLGREFFESAAGYHLGKPEAKTMGEKNRATVYAGGLAITLMTLMPMLNLFVPILATVWMVHVYHGLRKRTIQSESGANQQ
jgi:CysZ protein